MLLLTSPELVMKTVFTGLKATGILLPRDEEDFRPAYQRYLTAMQPKCIWLRNANHNLIQDLSNGQDSKFKQQLSELFNGEATKLDDLDQTNIINRRMASNSTASNVLINALNSMASLAPIHRNFLELCIERIFIEGSEDASGGSTSDAVGLIWANPHSKFDTNDVIEFLVHELTHNLLFLDEWVHPHYDYSKILLEETWCTSAILKRKRPIDKVVHSLVVAGELVLLRLECLGEPNDPKAHPPTDQIVEAIITSIEDLRSLPSAKDYVYPRVWQLLDIIEDRICYERRVNRQVA